MLGADGMPDAAFGPPRLKPGIARDLAVQADDKVLVVSVHLHPERGGIVRYDTGGTYDEDFGGDGGVSPDLGPEGNSLFAIAIQPDGKLMVAGGAGVGISDAYNGDVFTDAAIARLLPDGTLDETFGEGGKRIPRCSKEKTTPDCSTGSGA